MHKVFDFFSNTLNIFIYPLSQAPLLSVVYNFSADTRLARKTPRPEIGMKPVNTDTSANNVYPDETAHLDLHCLPILLTIFD